MTYVTGDASPWDLDALLANRGLSLTQYLVVCATECRHPFAASGTALQWNSRNAHYARGAITSLQVSFANNYGSRELGPGASATYFCAIEYPVGTITPLTWSGLSSVTTASATDTPLSDPFAIAIPKNALFYTRVYATCANGVPYVDYGSGIPLGGAEFAVSGLANKANSGSIPTGGGVRVVPSLIVGNTTNLTVGVIGDSIVQGLGETSSPIANGIGIINRTIASKVNYISEAVASEEMGGANGFLLNSVKRLSRLQYVSHIICQLGRNDLISGRTAGVMQDNLIALIALLPAGKRVYQTTITPRSTSTDSWATVANQTVDSTNAQRILFNEAVRANAIVGLTGCLDVSDVLESSYNSGLWKAPGYTADGLHPNSNGYIQVVQNRVVQEVYTI